LHQLCRRYMTQMMTECCRVLGECRGTVAVSRSRSRCTQWSWGITRSRWISSSDMSTCCTNCVTRTWLNSIRRRRRTRTRTRRRRFAISNTNTPPPPNNCQRTSRFGCWTSLSVQSRSFWLLCSFPDCRSFVRSVRGGGRLLNNLIACWNLTWHAGSSGRRTDATWAS